MLALALMPTMAEYATLGEYAKSIAHLTIVMFQLKGARTQSGPNNVLLRRADNAAMMAFYGGFVDDVRIEHREELEAGMKFAKSVLSAAYKRLSNEHKATTQAKH